MWDWRRKVESEEGEGDREGGRDREKMRERIREIMIKRECARGRENKLENT